MPQTSHEMSVRPTEPEPSVTPFGEMKIPDPETHTADPTP